MSSAFVNEDPGGASRGPGGGPRDGVPAGGHAEQIAGLGGQPMVRMRSADGAAADVYQHGAQVTSWWPANEAGERLYLSGRSSFNGRDAIRGGIPVIFPQFATNGLLPRHGFARVRSWTLSGVEEQADGDVVASFVLVSSPETRAIWDMSFLASVTVRIGGPRLVVTLSVENTSAGTMRFTGALHTYLRVHDVANVELIGLHGTPYRDSSSPGPLRVDPTEALNVDGAMDRVYVNAPRRLVLREGTRELLIESAEFPDAVVWNPGADAAARLTDLDADGEREMLCVEAAIVETPVLLESGRRWSGSQTLTARQRAMRPV